MDCVVAPRALGEVLMGEQELRDRTPEGAEGALAEEWLSWES